MGTVNQMMLKFRRKNYEHTEFWEKSQTWVAGEIAHKTGWVGFISKPETGGTGLNLWKFQTGQKVEVHSQLDKWIDPNIRMFRAYRGKPSRAGRQWVVSGHHPRSLKTWIYSRVRPLRLRLRRVAA